jgi:hypothetical protein
LALLISEKRANFINLTIWIIFNLIFQAWFAINPTYTGASLFAGGAAAAFINYGLIQNLVLSDLFRKFIFTYAALLTILCYGIRKEGIYILAILIIPTILIRMKRFKNGFQIIKFYLIPIIILYVFNYLLYSFLYSNEKWDQYMALNDTRHKIQLRAPEKYIANNLTEVGWNAETYFMFARFSLIDEGQMNIEKLQKILETTQEFVGPKSILQMNLAESIPIVKAAFSPWTWILKIQIVMILIIGLSKIKDKIFGQYIIFLIFQAVFLLIFILVLSTGYQIPERISLNLLAGLTLSMFAQMSVYNKIKLGKNLITTLSSLILVIISIYLFQTRLSVETKAREGMYLTRQVYANQQINSLSKLKDQTVISFGSGLKTDWRFPYNKWKSFDPRDKTITLGWLNLSPISQEQFKMRNSNLANFPKGVINNEIYWVDSPEEINISRDYFQQFTERKLDFSDEGKIGNDEYHFYRFSTIE